MRLGINKQLSMEERYIDQDRHVRWRRMTVVWQLRYNHGGELRLHAHVPSYNHGEYIYGHNYARTAVQDSWIQKSCLWIDR
jgi:hypothetical protein